MEKIIFQNGKYGNTVFEVHEGQIFLRWLFGMPMDRSGVGAPERVRGIVDFDFGPGGCFPEDAHVIGWDKQENELKIRYEISDCGIEFLTVWKMDAELGILSRKDFITNPGDCEALIFKFWPKFIFASGEYECYVQNSTWCYENKGAWAPLGRAGVCLQSEGGRTTQGAAPFLGLRSTAYGRGVAFHIVPKGNWEIRLQRASAGVGPQGSEVTMLRLGQSAERFTYELEPDGMVEMPELIIQALPDGQLHSNTESLQKWLRKTDVSPNRCRHKVVYNPWYCCYHHINIDEMMANAKVAKELGCDVFEVDAGWYGQNEDWGCDVGDWREKQDGAFYGKLKDFADQIRELGMGFGLWMEPERIAAGAPMRKEHPDWFARACGGCFYPKLWEPEPYNYIKSEMLRLIETYGLAWMKIDFNTELEEDDTRSQLLCYYENWYRMIDEIKALHPDVFIEACASGGLRSDINTMRHFDGHFICDNVNPYDGQSMFEQLMMRTMPYKVYQWLAVQRGADIPTYFRDISDVERTVVVPQAPGAGFGDYEKIDLDFLCKLIIRGMFGITGNIASLDKEELEILKKYIAFYKEFQPLLENSTVTIDSEPTSIGERNHWRVQDYYWEEKDEHMMYVYRFGDIRTAHVTRPSHVCEEKTYAVMRKDSTVKMTGKELMECGIEVELGRYNSGEIIYIRPEEV